MYPHHEKVFRYLQNNHIRIGELVVEEGVSKVLFCVHQYGEDRLFHVWKNLPPFFGESVNIELSSVGLLVSLPNYNEFKEDDTTEVLSEGGSCDRESPRELEVPETRDASTHLKAPISERFGFIL